MTVLAAIGMRRGYLRGPALVYASSDQGPNCVIGVNP
jgi:hypothetical protein